MRITIEINTENDAFRESYADEVDQVLQQAKRTAELWQSRGVTLDQEAVLFDSNGSRCGFIRGGVE